MIASVLRAEIDRLVAEASDPTLSRVAEGLLRAARSTETSPPTAEQLTCRAFLERLALRLALPGADAERVEADLDSLDDLVTDPRELHTLRAALHALVERVHFACDEEADRKRDGDVSVSAA
jgi:hypothetical protein